MPTPRSSHRDKQLSKCLLRNNVNCETPEMFNKSMGHISATSHRVLSDRYLNNISAVYASWLDFDVSWSVDRGPWIFTTLRARVVASCRRAIHIVETQSFWLIYPLRLSRRPANIATVMSSGFTRNNPDAFVFPEYQFRKFSIRRRTLLLVFRTWQRGDARRYLSASIQFCFFF